MTVGETLRAARNAADISLSVMATRTHYSKPYLSMVETGKRAATTDVISAYEKVLGVGLLSDDVNRRVGWEAGAVVEDSVSSFPPSNRA